MSEDSLSIDNHKKRMPLIEHLQELKSRVVQTLAIFLIAFIYTYLNSKSFYTFLASPLMNSLENGENLVFLGVAEPFITYLKTAIVSAFIISSPVFIYHSWAFIVPGFFNEEKFMFFLIVVFSFLLFITGVAFSYYFVFPMGFKFLIGFAEASTLASLSMASYFNFAIKLLLAFGIVFQLPLFIFVLARLGLVTAMSLIGFWRYALLIAVIGGALLTPPDVMSQIVLGSSIMVLYFIGVVIAFLFGKADKETTSEGSGSEK